MGRIFSHLGSYRLGPLLALLAIALILTLSQPSAHAVVAQCEPKDLRNLATAPLRNQVYRDQSGHYEDSCWCYAFGLANAAAQTLGFAVAPEHIALNANRDHALGFGGTAEKLFLYSGDTKDAHLKVTQAGGYVSANEFAKVSGGSNWYTKLLDQTHGKTSTEFLAQINSSCPCTQIPAGWNLNIENVQWGSGFELSQSHAMRRLDSALDANRMVVIAFDTVPGGIGMSHIVTVVGRTVECKYIIQDSIPVSTWGIGPYLKLFTESEGEHYQFWDSEVLAKHIAKVGFFEPTSDCVRHLLTKSNGQVE